MRVRVYWGAVFEVDSKREISERYASRFATTPPPNDLRASTSASRRAQLFIVAIVVAWLAVLGAGSAFLS